MALEETLCPDCGGPMVPRSSKYGKFWGCKAYPSCKGTRDSMGRSKSDQRAAETACTVCYERPGTQLCDGPLPKGIICRRSSIPGASSSCSRRLCKECALRRNGNDYCPECASYALDALALSETQKALASQGELTPLARLAETEHYRAVGASALFSTEHWKHNAGPGWPDVDDGSYTAFENCTHPQCKAARTLIPTPPPQEP